jgi:hypothetical protein
MHNNKQETTKKNKGKEQQENNNARWKKPRTTKTRTQTKNNASIKKPNLTILNHRKRPLQADPRTTFLSAT